MEVNEDEVRVRDDAMRASMDGVGRNEDDVGGNEDGVAGNEDEVGSDEDGAGASKDGVGTDGDGEGVSKYGVGRNWDVVRVSDGLRVTENPSSNWTCTLMQFRMSSTEQVGASWRSKTGRRYPGKCGRSASPAVPHVFRSSNAEASPTIRRQGQDVPLPLVCMAGPLSV